MSLSRKLLWVAILAYLGPLAATPLAAQLNSEAFARIGFNFSPPGARAAALGGAFVGVADDATAAESNPAGLSLLLYPQATLEFKAVEYKIDLPDEAGGGPSGREFSNQVAFPSFASVVVPFGDVTLGLTANQLVNYRSAVGASGYELPSGSHLFPYTANLSLDVTNVGGAASLKLGPSLSVGVAGGASLLAMELDHSRYRVNNTDPGYRVNQIEVSEELGSKTSGFLNAGALLHVGRLNLGAAYKLRPKFNDVGVSYITGTGETFDPVDGRLPDSVFTLKVPDSFGGGLSLRATDRLTLAASGEWILYSQVPESQGIVVDFGADLPEYYTADDGLDLHGGLEYVLSAGTTPIALRAGVSSLAASNTYFSGPDDEDNEGTVALWGTEPDDSTLQYSAGFGTVLFSHLQLDVAGVFSDRRAEVVTSFVVFW
jgi:long-chain fatty acid transport protein